MESMRTNDPPGGDPTAVFGRRCSAYIIDFIILLVVVVIAISSFATLEEFDDPDSAAEVCREFEDLKADDLCFNVESSVFVLEADAIGYIAILVIAVAALNSVIISTITGGSLGKLAVGIRVVDKSTFERTGFLKHLLRWILLIVDTFPWFLLVPLTGLILGLASRGHRRVGDFAAGTLVVEKRHVGRPALVPGVNEAAVSPVGLPGLWDPPVQPPPTQPPPTQPPPTEPIAPEPIAEQPTTAAHPEPDTSGVHEPHAGGTPEPDLAGQAQGAQPGVDAPTWDTARDTYIQWDHDLEAWMEWDESQGRWIPISQ